MMPSMTAKIGSDGPGLSGASHPSAESSAAFYF
jgi:hypothetical protein